MTGTNDWYKRLASGFVCNGLQDQVDAIGELLHLRPIRLKYNFLSS